MEGMTLEDENVLLKAENAALREQVSLLVAQVQDLQARLAKDSHNSSKPPSSDGLTRKTKSLRRRSGKKPGGQIGHRGDTLRLAALPRRGGGAPASDLLEVPDAAVGRDNGGTAGATSGPGAAARPAGGHGNIRRCTCAVRCARR